MTIALGILATDGIVLATDTELSWGGTRKTEGAKIEMWPDDGLAIAGAGDVNYMEALSERIHAAVQSVRTPDVALIRRKVQAALVNFHHHHILPWNDPNLGIWLLIGIERGNQRALWVTSKATMRPCVCAAVGAGSVEADALLVGLFGLKKRPMLDLDTARLIAGYIAHVAKDRIPGCGKNTDMVLINGGTVEHLSRGTVSLLEHHIGEFLELQTRLAQFTLGAIRVDDTREAAGHLAKFFLSARTRYREAAEVRVESERWTLGYPAGEMRLAGNVFVPVPRPSVEPDQAQPADPPTHRRSTRGRKGQPPSRG